MQSQPNGILNLIPMGMVLLIIYVFLIRPQQKQQKEHDAMLEALKTGDKILTTGGLYGTIVGVRGNDLEVKFSDTVKLLVAKSAVARRLTEGQPAKTGTAA
jgi:preprotein translocase subunit YajC